MQQTPHFKLNEFTRSSKAVELGISKEPGPSHLLNLRKLAASLEEVRALLGTPINITSAYRSPPVNAAVGGSSTSDHANGLAADFTSRRFGTVREVCEAIASSRIRFDQLIYEQKPGGTLRCIWSSAQECAVRSCLGRLHASTSTALWIWGDQWKAM